MKGHVHRRGKRWAYKYDAPPDPLTGERRVVTKSGFLTEKEAWAACREAIAKAEKGAFVAPSLRKLGPYLEDEWFPMVRNSLKASTFASYEDYARAYVIPVLGEVRLQALDAQRLNAFYDHLLKSGRVKARTPAKPATPKMRGRASQARPTPKKPLNPGLAPKTVRNVHVMLHKALGDALAWRYVEHNAAEHAKPPRARRRKPTIWTVEQLAAFLTGQYQDRFYALYLLAATTGMRRSEVCGLRWSSLDLEDGTVDLDETRVVVRGQATDSDGKSNDSVRRLALDPATVAALVAHRKLQEEERALFGSGWHTGNYVFRWEDGRPVHPDTIRQRFNRAVAHLALPRIRLHDMRHTYATAALRAGIAPKVISARLGHASAAFTMDVYAHALPTMDRDAADAVAALILGGRDAWRL